MQSKQALTNKQAFATTSLGAKQEVSEARRPADYANVPGTQVHDGSADKQRGGRWRRMASRLWK